MLDTATKKRIDDCRDIRVGKVPDPKSQVEQITIALIYKFMDDMDAEAEELGGHRRFFAGTFARFGWAKLMAPSLGGFEVLALYSEAIQSMRANPGVPELFRDIFKNAYLPYRDPETLKSFLKEINHFSYDHSERLGDAFEYLLSVLGSQGDAGQFRTPRHIIDFMVAVIDPQKHETILDPACGTAGFRISAWKHILAANTSGAAAQNGDSKETNTVKREAGNLLTPDERTRLAANIKGYDISPDMVRLSLANLYLHGFADPHVVEYDTLTQDDKWNELADVILANPPFMSPKGGIKPHKRFSVQATRSEVLFVDYMAEHLSATGRAAIVVPEGIIFQSGTAYKALRKMLVESSLVAVVSLPAGVFNPYSGVKTSILILDKRVHKQTSHVLFVKVQNDGFNLGAQRRAVVNSDLPEATRLLRRWMTAPNAFEGDSPLAQAVERVRIEEGGDFGLSGDRYVAALSQAHAYPLVPVSEIVDRVNDSMNPSETDGEITYVGLENIESNSGCLVGEIVATASDIKSLKSRFQPNDVLYGKLRPNLNKVHLAGVSGICSTDIFVLRAGSQANAAYLTQLFRSPQFNLQVLRGIGGAQLPRVSYEYLSALKIPLPPLEVQHQIVAEIDGYQKVIDGARQVVDNYKPQIAFQPEWGVAKVDDICTLVRGSSPRPQGDPQFFGGTVPRLMVADITRDGMRVTPAIDTLTELGAQKSRPMLAGSVVMAVSGNPGLPAILQVNACIHDGFVGFRDLRTELLLPEFFYYVLLANKEKNKSQSVGAVFMNLTTDQIREFLIPLPDLETQRDIVAEIEAEQALVNANRELIRRMEAKIKTAIDRVWSAA